MFIFDTLKEYASVVTLFLSLATLIATLYSSGRSLHYPFRMECHNNLISPLFLMFEPYTRSNIPENVIIDAIALCRDNYQFMIPSILPSYRECQHDHSCAPSFYDAVMDSYYRSCQQLGIGRVPLSQRASGSRKSFVQYVIVSTILFFLALVLSLLVLATIVALVFDIFTGFLSQL